MKILVTGGAGFIGSAFIRYVIQNTTHEVVNIDKLTYAGNLESLSPIAEDKRYSFDQVDICNAKKLNESFKKHKPDCVIHLAAESHVDKSIDSPADFINTNIVGTYHLLQASRAYWEELNHEKKFVFRFHHVSTDEVFGDLPHPDENITPLSLFDENSPYAPSSPYSASKASSDHLVKAWERTYKLPTILTNCSNNYGPYQFPEKLIPLVILNALEGKALPIYGNGSQIRDWLYVEDHAKALLKVLTQASPGSCYNIGGHNEMRNIDVVNAICTLLDQSEVSVAKKGLKDSLVNGRQIKSYSELINFVKDRPGHDRRYAIDASRIKKELDWSPSETFETGLKKTVDWYLRNLDWCRNIQDGSYIRNRQGVLL